jgi:phosphonate transport system ATP-binding protein
MYQPESKLAAQALSAGYAADEIISNLDLEIERGSVTAIIGANGAGKTSLLKALARKIPAAKGTVLLDGVSIASLSKTELSKTFGFLAAIPAAKNLETVFELVSRSAMAANQISRVSPRLRDEIDTLLERTSLTAVKDKRIGELSSGYKQCAVIAAALVKNPEVLLLDEPTSSLDPKTSVEIMELLDQVSRQRQVPVIVNIHNVDLARRFATRIIGMSSGKVVFDGPPEALQDKHLNEIYGGEDWQA